MARRKVIRNPYGIKGAEMTEDGRFTVLPWTVVKHSLMMCGLIGEDAEPREGEDMIGLLRRCGTYPIISPDWPVRNGHVIVPNLDGSFPEMPSAPERRKPAQPKTPRLPSGKEGQLQASLADTLDRDGWYVRREVRTPNGHIDIVATKPDVTLVIEVKRGSPTECAKAIGQVLMYCATLPGRVRPVIAVPAIAVHHKDLQALCKRFEVELWPID